MDITGASLYFFGDFSSTISEFGRYNGDIRHLYYPNTAVIATITASVFRLVIFLKVYCWVAQNHKQGASDSERGVSPSDSSDVSRSKNGGNEVTFRSMGLGESEIFRKQHQMKRNSKI